MAKKSYLRKRVLRSYEKKVAEKREKEKLPELSTYITGSDSKLRQLYYPHPANHHHEEDADTDVDEDDVDADDDIHMIIDKVDVYMADRQG